VTAATLQIFERGRQVLEESSMLSRQFEELTLRRQLVELIHELQEKQIELVIQSRGLRGG
jgi:hypothetical protein